MGRGQDGGSLSAEFLRGRGYTLQGFNCVPVLARLRGRKCLSDRSSLDKTIATFQNKKRRTLLKDRSHPADLKSDHTEALTAKIMVFPDILNSTI